MAKSQSKRVVIEMGRNHFAMVPVYFGVNDAEIYSGMSRWTWRRYAYRGIVASTKVGGRLLIPKAEIDRVMQEGLRPALVQAERV